jgi:hypothetical protein
MTLQEYFAVPENPMAGSPVGRLMVKIVDKYPGIDFEEARKKAKELLLLAAGQKRYRFPEVLSESELVAERERLKALKQARQNANPRTRQHRADADMAKEAV